jgi:hypothetical protein
MARQALCQLLPATEPTRPTATAHDMVNVYS